MNFEVLREIVRVRRTAFIFLVLLALADAFLYGYLQFWQKPALDRVQKKLVHSKEAAAGAAVGTPAARYRAGVHDLQLFRERVIAKKDFPKFLSELFESARNNSLTFKEVTYKPAPIPEEGLVSYAIGFTVTGRYASVKSFIADLSRYREIVTLDSLGLNNQSRTEEHVDLRVQITTYLKQEGA